MSGNGVEFTWEMIEKVTAPLAAINSQMAATTSAIEGLADKINGVAKTGEKIHGVGSAFGEMGNQILSAAAGFGLWTTAQSVIEGVIHKVEETVTAVFNVREELEKYNVVMKNLMGTQQAATDAEAMLERVAGAHAVRVDQLREVYSNLAFKGFKASQQELVKFADIAAAAGKPISNLMEAVESAGLGMTRGLKQYGVEVMKLGENAGNVMVTSFKGGHAHQQKEIGNGNLEMLFRGHKTIIKDNEKAIRDYMLSLGTLPGILGTSAQMMDTMAGKETTIFNKMEDLHKAIGDVWGDSMSAWLDFKINAVDAVIAGLKWFEDNGAEIKNVFEEIAGAIAGITASIVAGWATGWVKYLWMMRAVIAETISAISFTEIWTGVQWALNAALTANPIGAVILAITALAVIIKMVWDHCEGFRFAVFFLWDTVKTFFPMMYHMAVEVVKGIGDAFKGLGEIIIGTFTLNPKMFTQGLDDLHASMGHFSSISSIRDAAANHLANAYDDDKQKAKESFAYDQYGNTAPADDNAPMITPLNASKGGNKDKTKDNTTDNTSSAAGGVSGGAGRSVVINKIENHLHVKDSQIDLKKLMHHFNEMMIAEIRDTEVAVSNG